MVGVCAYSRAKKRGRTVSAARNRRARALSNPTCRTLLALRMLSAFAGWRARCLRRRAVSTLDHARAAKSSRWKSCASPPRAAPQGYRFEVYDAADLFKRATDLLNQQKCREAVELYDRLAREFADSRYASASLYNAGLCLQALGRLRGVRARRYGALRDRYPNSEDRKDASFQLAEVLVQLERFGRR